MFFKLQILYYLVRIKMGRWLFNKGLFPVQRFRIRHLRKVLRRSPFYRDLIVENASLYSLPLMNKSLFMQHFERINTCGLDLGQCMDVALKAEHTRNFSPMIQGISVGLSTGTSGNRGLFLVSERERAAWVACVIDRVIGFSFRRRKVAFFLRANNNLYQSARSRLLQFEYFDIYLPMEDHLSALVDLNPDIIVAQPSVLCMIAEAVSAGGLKLTPAKIISVAEVLSPEDRRFLEDIFGQKIHQVYQCTEGFLAASCAHGTLHFNEDFLLVERKYINEEKTRFHPVVTDLLRVSQPVVRYELNDIVVPREYCPCGSRMAAIEAIEGRSDDILLFKSQSGKTVRLFPDLFRRSIVLADESVTDYCLVQGSSETLKLYIKSGSPNAYERVSAALVNTLAQHDIGGIHIERVEEDPFLIGSKKRRVRNEVPQAS